MNKPFDLTELNKRLHEIMGLCFHVRSANQCIKCHRVLVKAIGEGKFECLPANIDFLTWEGFGILWEWLSKRHGYGAFMHRYGYGSEEVGWYLKECFINPRALAEAVVEFFGKEAVSK